MRKVELLVRFLFALGYYNKSPSRVFDNLSDFPLAEDEVKWGSFVVELIHGVENELVLQIGKRFALLFEMINPNENFTNLTFALLGM